MGIVWGALSGFTSTLVQVGSLPFQIHMLPQRLDKLTLWRSHSASGTHRAARGRGIELPARIGENQDWRPAW
jgi:hypothetical protein